MRLAFWIVRVVFAAFAGAIVRFLRRIAGKPPRIWHGPMPLHAIRYMVAADRAAGYPSLSVVLTERQPLREACREQWQAEGRVGTSATLIGTCASCYPYSQAGRLVG